MLKRLQTVKNLHEKDARYHSRCLSLFYMYKPVNYRGHLISEDMSSCAAYIINNILNNADDSQLSLNDILENYQGEIPRLSRITEKLKEHFGDDLIIYPVQNDSIMCFHDSRDQVLQEN